MKPDIPEANFDEAKSFVITGKMLNRLMRELRRMAPNAGRGLIEHTGANGTFLEWNELFIQGVDCTLIFKDYLDEEIARLRWVNGILKEASAAEITIRDEVTEEDPPA
jgi:hypothetical protein